MFQESFGRITPLKYRYILAFGSNQGSKQFNLEQGLDEIIKNNQLVKLSKFIETEPLRSDFYETDSHEYYCNMVCELQSNLKPLELYKKIVTIEDRVGHNRTGKWLPRKLDIDLILWAKNSHSDFNLCPPLFFSQGDFTVPHKELSKRGFLLDLCYEDLKLTKSCLQKHIAS